MIFKHYTDEELQSAEQFTSAIGKFLEDYRDNLDDESHNEKVHSEIQSMIENYEAASLELYSEIKNRKDAKTLEENE